MSLFNFQTASLNFSLNLGLETGLSIGDQKGWAQHERLFFPKRFDRLFFGENATEIAAEANQWVESVTRNRIKNLLQPNSLYAQTALLLINALYFKGLLLDKFSTGRTKK